MFIQLVGSTFPRFSPFFSKIPAYNPHPISNQNKITRMFGLQSDTILDPPTPTVCEKKGTPQKILGGDFSPPPTIFSEKFLMGNVRCINIYPW